MDSKNSLQVSALPIYSSSSSRGYFSIKHTRKSTIVLLMTQYKGISVVLIEQEAPNKLAVFRVKILPVNVHVLLQQNLNLTTVNVLVYFKTKNKHKKTQRKKTF